MVNMAPNVRLSRSIFRTLLRATKKMDVNPSCKALIYRNNTFTGGSPA